MSQKDETNFTSSSSHRLPTVSAASALHGLHQPENKVISTGLPLLDNVLASNNTNSAKGGFLRGHVVDIYGPPGSGKTAIGIQAAASTIHSGKSVVWIDTRHRIVGSRLASVISNFQWPNEQDLPSSPPSRKSSEDLLKQFTHFTVPTLPHLLVLTAQPLGSFPPKDTSLIVIDDISSLFATAFPRVIEHVDNNRQKKPDAIQWASGRRWALMGEFTARMSKLAITKNVAILLLSQASTKVRTEHGALLRPALTSKSWLENINTRLVVFRDFLSGDNTGMEMKDNKNVGFVGVVKHAGTYLRSLEKVFPFTIDKNGLHPIEPQTSVELPVLPAKRKRDEVGDSQSEGEDEYELGSDDEDESFNEVDWPHNELVTIEEAGMNIPDV